MADTVSTTYATTAANTLLRNAATDPVLLRLPSPAAALISEQLGLATPYFHDVQLAPVVIRKARTLARPDKPQRLELLISSATIEAILGDLSYDSASILFAEALGVVIHNELFAIEAAPPEQLGTTPYLYRLTLRAPQAEIV